MVHCLELLSLSARKVELLGFGLRAQRCKQRSSRSLEERDWDIRE
jgi:hypothetical protein